MNMAIKLLYKESIVTKCNLNLDLIKSGENSINLSFSFSTIIPKDSEKKDCSIKLLTTFSNEDKVFFTFELTSSYSLESREKETDDEIKNLLNEQGLRDTYIKAIDYVNKFCEISNIPPLPMPAFDEVKPQ